jgi:hypothetical protein
MLSRKLTLSATATAVLACAATFAPPVLSAPLSAQLTPTLTDVVPESGVYALQGKIQALDPVALTLTIVSDVEPPVTTTVAAGVNLTGFSVGEVVNVLYKRSVTLVVGSPNVAVGQVPATSTVDQAVQNPDAIGYNSAVVVGRVVKVDGPNSFDVVNADGGGIYTIETTDPTREIANRMLKVGDSVTVAISPLMVTAVSPAHQS